MTLKTKLIAAQMPLIAALALLFGALGAEGEARVVGGVKEVG